MFPDESPQCPQSFIRLSSPGKHGGNVRVEGNHNGTLGVTGCVLIRPSLTEVVLWKNFINSNPAA